uniref:Centromere/kinetochore protein zw10 middle domain-containing protein n=1 Tax=Acrobeloides nanus TaxID=290746 RepID=A0A914DB87_9BILA
MAKLGIMDIRMQETADVIMSQFCDRIVHAANPKSILSFRDGSTSKNGETVFVISKQVSRTEIPEPTEVFETLTSFFKEFHHIFADAMVDKSPFLTQLGMKFAPRLIDMLVKDCLTPSIPYDKHNEEKYQNLIHVAIQFYDWMKEMKYFTGEAISLEQFINNYDQIFINRRCLRIVTSARELITQQYIDLTP